MADGIGKLRRNAMLNWLTGNTATAPAGFSFSVWAADPGDDGQSSAEVAPTGYARPGASGTGSGVWTAASNTTNDITAVTTNAAAISFGTWSTGPTTAAFVAIWTTTGTTAANFVARCAVSGSPSVNAGATVSISIGNLSLGMDP